MPRTIPMPVWRNLALVLALGCVAGAAQANEAAAKSALDALDALLLAINNGINTFSGGDPFLALGKKIAVTLFGIVLIWGIIKNWVTGRGMLQIVGDVMQPLVLLGLTLFAIENGLGIKIRDSILSLANVLANSVGASMNGLELRLMQGFADAGFTILEMKVEATFWDSLGNAISTFSGGAIAFLFGWVVRVAAGLFMLVAGATAAAVILVAKISIALALVMAPVMIPWGMWRPTEFLFTSWLRFLITSSMQVVVAVALGGILSSAVTTIGGISSQFTSNEASIGLTSALILFSALCLYIMLQASALASGLVSGDGTIGMRGWSAPSMGVQRGMQTSGGAALGSFRAGAAAANGAYKGYRAIRSGGAAQATGAPGASAGGSTP